MLVSGHKPLRVPPSPQWQCWTLKVGLEGRSDITNVLQHCHGGKGIFNNILLIWDKVGPLPGVWRMCLE